MPKARLDKETKRLLLDARRWIQDAEKADCNEAGTRQRIEEIFRTVTGYDVFKNLSREKAIRGAGETEYIDYAIQLEANGSEKPEIVVEIKRVCIDLALKHLKQVSSYAINAGCEWILLTNGKEWKLYHVSFGQPPVTKLVQSWNLLTDELSDVAAGFNLISYKNVKKGGLDQLWQKSNILNPRNLLQAILSESSLRGIRRELRKDSGIMLSPEEIVSGVCRLLNETALIELENVRMPRKQQVKTTKENVTPKDFALQQERLKKMTSTEIQVAEDNTPQTPPS